MFNNKTINNNHLKEEVVKDLNSAQNVEQKQMEQNSAQSVGIRSDRRMQYRLERERVRSKMQGNSCRLLDTE